MSEAVAKSKITVPELKKILGVKTGKKDDLYAQYLATFSKKSGPKEEKKRYVCEGNVCRIIPASPKKSPRGKGELKAKYLRLKTEYFASLSESSAISFKKVEKIFQDFEKDVLPEIKEISRNISSLGSDEYGKTERNASTAASIIALCKLAQPYYDLINSAKDSELTKEFWAVEAEYEKPVLHKE
jgi:hypothetical protein